MNLKMGIPETMGFRWFRYVSVLDWSKDHLEIASPILGSHPIWPCQENGFDSAQVVDLDWDAPESVIAAADLVLASEVIYQRPTVEAAFVNKFQ